MLHAVNSVPEKFSMTHETLNKLFAMGKKYRFMFDDGYQSIFNVLASAVPEICRRVHIFLVVAKIGGVNDWDVSGELFRKRLLDWEQILELQSLGVRFGSHSLTHTDLTKLEVRELDREVKESKFILEEKIGQSVEGFAYPFGYFNGRVITAVKDAGYKWAVTTSDSIWEGFGNPYRMRRINVSGLDPDWLLRVKINGLYDIKAVWELPRLIREKVTLYFSSG
jgi:hypothetical protein